MLKMKLITIGGLIAVITFTRLRDTFAVRESSFSPNFDPQACITAGSRIAINCTVVQDEDGVGTTQWSGSHSIFNCPSPNSNSNYKITLCHPNVYKCQENPSGTCGLASAQLLWSENGIHTSVLTIQNTTLAMDGGNITCTFHSTDLIGELIDLKIEG